MGQCVIRKVFAQNGARHLDLQGGCVCVLLLRRGCADDIDKLRVPHEGGQDP